MPTNVELGAGVPSGPGGISLTTPLANTPDWTTNLSVSYEIGIWGGASLTPRVDWNYSDRISGGAQDFALIRQSSYDVVNANLTYLNGNGDWRIVAGVTNLTDELYFRAAGFSGAGGVATVAYARPREWYLQIKHDF